MCNNGLLDTIEVLPALEFDLVLVAKLDVCSCQSASESSLPGSSSSLNCCSRPGAVVVRSIALVVAGSDNLSDKVGHVHLDVEFAEVYQRVELDVDETVW